MVSFKDGQTDQGTASSLHVCNKGQKYKAGIIGEKVLVRPWLSV